MLRSGSFLLPVTILLNASCVKPPATAGEFRKLAASGSTRFVAHETFEVPRSHEAIGKTLEQQSEKCLQVSVVAESSGGYGSNPSTFRRDLNPTVQIDETRAQLIVQVHIEGTNMVRVYDEAKGGDFVLIADAHPVARKQSKVDLYHATVGYDVLVQAVRSWIMGDSKACPDLTQ